MTTTLQLGDRAGIVAAVACAIHCLATPLLAASVQAAKVFASERNERIILVTSLLISGATVAARCLRRGARHMMWTTFTCGAGLLLWTRVGELPAGHWEQGLVVAGASLIIAAHAINLLGCRCSGVESCADIG